MESLVELALGVVEVSEDRSDAGAALASAGGWVDERDFVDLVQEAHRELGAERESLLLDAGVVDSARSISETIISAIVV